MIQNITIANLFKRIDDESLITSVITIEYAQDTKTNLGGTSVAWT